MKLQIAIFEAIDVQCFRADNVNLEHNSAQKHQK